MPETILKKTGKFIFLCVAPLILILAGGAMICCDFWRRLHLLLRRKPSAPEAVPGWNSAGNGGSVAAQTPPIPVSATLDSVAARRPLNASIVIPNWNGKDLLEKFLPSVVEATSEGDEIIVVDNASSDGSADFIRRRFPRVTVMEAERNLGFGGGANWGVQAARNRIAVLLNNDMRVTPDFLRPLLEGFTDDDVFAVSAQIFFRDPERRREETGLTSGVFEKGFLRVRHEIDSDITMLYPSFYGGGGSTAYDRDKFLELGGFDSLFEPFYLEDTDLSYCAWRRGWKVLYQPNSRVYHEHRGTIGKHYSQEAIQAYVQKNYVLMVWKNVHRRRWLVSHFFHLYSHMVLCWMGRATETRTTIGAFFLALRSLPRALRSRSRALERATVDDAAVFARIRPSVFRDTFSQARDVTLSLTATPVHEAEAHVTPAAEWSSPNSESSSGRPLNILFVSPYSIYPPIHGGAVFMLEAIREMSKRHNLYVLAFVDRQEEVESNRALEETARKVTAYVRRPVPTRYFSLRPNAEAVFWDPAFAALLDKYVYLYDIDVIQFEYTQLAQYRLPLRHTPQCLFEHDVYFRSVGRHMLSHNGGFLLKARESLEWLRALRFELGAVEKFDAVFTCHEEEKRLLESFLNGRRPPIFSGMRAVIDVRSHPFPGGPRQPDSLLFVGNFQHAPNVDGLMYFYREVLPLIRDRRPSVTFNIVGANATPQIQREVQGEGIRFPGRVPDIREPLSEYAVFVCPILTGAGMRVKILEAFSSGIPVVSTRLGAEGLTGIHGTHYMLADTPSEFAEATLYLLEHPDAAIAMAANARQLVETTYDWPAAANRLEEVYRQLIASLKG